MMERAPGIHGVERAEGTHEDVIQDGTQSELRARNALGQVLPRILLRCRHRQRIDIETDYGCRAARRSCNREEAGAAPDVEERSANELIITEQHAQRVFRLTNALRLEAGARELLPVATEVEAQCHGASGVKRRSHVSRFNSAHSRLP